jgi:hypothetical protein
VREGEKGEEEKQSSSSPALSVHTNRKTHSWLMVVTRSSCGSSCGGAAIGAFVEKRRKRGGERKREAIDRSMGDRASTIQMLPSLLSLSVLLSLSLQLYAQARHARERESREEAERRAAQREVEREREPSLLLLPLESEGTK